MAAIDISDAADGANIFVQMTGYRYQEVTGAKSISLTEAQNKLTVYDLSTYRDLLSAGELGRAWNVQIADAIAPATAIDGTIADNGVTWTDQAVESAGSIGAEHLDDRVSHTAPREWAKPDTMIMWWDTAGGTGNCLAMCRYAEFVSYSNVRPLLMF